MPAVFALQDLYTKVTARFVADGRGPLIVPQPFGWREPDRQRATVERIVWVPGDDDSGDLGKVLPPRYPGGNPRSLGTLNELFTCYISSQAPSDASNELEQYRAARLLYDEWFRAVYLAAVDTFQILRSTWITEKNQSRYGAAIRVLGAIQSMIPDYTLEAVPADAKAQIAVVELDHTEPTFEAPP